MDIAALSILLSQGSLQQQTGISVMKMAMDAVIDQGNSLAVLASDFAKSMELAVQPHLGANIDISA